MWKNLLPRTFNDVLALLVLIIVIPGLWIVDGAGALDLSGEVTGALILAWGLVIQYYFRRSPPAPPVP